MTITSFAIFTIFEIVCLREFVKRRNKALVSEVIVSYVLTSALLLWLYFDNVSVPKYMIILFLLCLVMNTFLGYYLNLYNESKTFDRYLHAFGSFSFSILAYSILSDVFNQTFDSDLFAGIIVFSLGITLGTIFEIIEFISDKSRNTKHQHGLADTDYDMIFNMIGSVIAAVYVVLFIN